MAGLPIVLKWVPAEDPLLRFFRVITKVRDCDDAQFASLCTALPELFGRLAVQGMLEHHLLSEVAAHTGELPDVLEEWLATHPPISSTAPQQVRVTHPRSAQAGWQTYPQGPPVGPRMLALPVDLLAYICSFLDQSTVAGAARSCVLVSRATRLPGSRCELDLTRPGVAARLRAHVSARRTHCFLPLRGVQRLRAQEADNLGCVLQGHRGLLDVQMWSGWRHLAPQPRLRWVHQRGLVCTPENLRRVVCAPHVLREITVFDLHLDTCADVAWWGRMVRLRSLTVLRNVRTSASHARRVAGCWPGLACLVLSDYSTCASPRWPRIRM